MRTRILSPLIDILSFCALLLGYGYVFSISLDIPSETGTRRIHYFFVGSAFAFGWFGGNGFHSMNPTLDEHSIIWTNYFETPKLGDIAQFYCREGSACHSETFETPIHRITDIRSDGCLWITGDNQPIAWDSNDYGWLCPDRDIWIVGKVYILRK